MPAKPQKVRLSRQSAKAQRRQRVIDAVFDCISRKGIVDTTVADIAAAAGVANGTVIQHFTSKQALMTEALKQLTREFDTISESAEQIPTDDPAARAGGGAVSPALCRRERQPWFAFWGGPVRGRSTRGCAGPGVACSAERWCELPGPGCEGLDVHAATHLLVAACEASGWPSRSYGTATARGAALAAGALFPVGPATY
jgi:AcrR family transcriptional regulator